MSINLEAIPASLRVLDQWVVWKLETREGKETKVPYQPDGRHARVNDPQTWSRFDEAVTAYRSPPKMKKPFAGIGFMFAGEHTGIDLDNYVNPTTGEIEEEAIRWLTLLDSYAEISARGTGLHILAEGPMPGPTGRRKNQKGTKHVIEMYSRGRFFTVTGNRIDGTPATVEPRTEQIAEMFHEIFPPKSAKTKTVKPAQPAKPMARLAPARQPAAGTAAESLSDERIIFKARNARNRKKFIALWEGRWEGFVDKDGSQPYPTQSEADMALGSLLHHWACGDKEQWERLMWQSGLDRDKWEERPDLLERIWEKIKDDPTRADGINSDYLPAGSENGDLTPEQIARLTELAEQYPIQSLVDFAEAEIDPTQTVLLDRFLCREGGLLFVAPSGVGKSSAIVYMSTRWTCGKKAFGFRPAQPLKILIVQAENDAGDMTEMTQDVIAQLSPADRETVHRNTVCISVKNLRGYGFIFVLDLFLQKHRPDLVLIDPFNSFSGGDPSNAELVTVFLRNWLNPLLEKHHCAALIVHHTPKTRGWDTSKWKVIDWAYAAAGNNDMTNWARAIVVIDATDDPSVYRFILAKRGQRAGWKDEFGTTAFERYYTWSKAGITWKSATPEQIAFVQSEARKKQLKHNQKFQKYTDRGLLKPFLETNDTLLTFSEWMTQVKISGCPAAKTTLWDRWQGFQRSRMIEELEPDKWSLSQFGWEFLGSSVGSEPDRTK